VLWLPPALIFTKLAVAQLTLWSTPVLLHMLPQSEEKCRKYGQSCIYPDQSNMGFSAPVFTKLTIAQRIFALLGCYVMQIDCYRRFGTTKQSPVDPWSWER